MTILASNATRPKAEYWPGVKVAEDKLSILKAIKLDPPSILRTPMVERADGDGLSTAQIPSVPGDLTVTSYGLNRIELRSATRMTGGLVVVKDVFAPGWHASVDGHTARVVRVNGMVRGVEIPASGGQVVVLEYRPLAFTVGLIITGVSAVFILLLAGVTRLSYATADAPGRTISTLGIAISAVVLISCMAVYFKFAAATADLAQFVVQRLL